MGAAHIALNVLVGPDDLSLAKTREEEGDESVVLQVNGVPVLVNPESMILKNSMGSANLGKSDLIGPDDVAFSQKNKPDDAVTLQVNGWPVLVNPESVLDINQMGAAHIALNVLVGPDDLSLT